MNWLQHIKFKNPKSSVTFKRFTVHFLTALNTTKRKVRSKSTSRIVLILIFTTTKPSLRQHHILRSLRKNKDIVITKPDKGNGAVILDRKLCNNTIEEIISNTSKFEKFSEDPTLKRKASLQRFLRKLKQKTFFNEIQYGKLYPSGSAPARIYGTAEIHKFTSSDSFSKLCPIVSSFLFPL